MIVTTFKILANTVQPCTTLDFYYYLNHKVHCAELLQFYLWLRDYSHRYNSPTLLKDTSTQKTWTAAQQEEALHKFQRYISNKKTPMSPTVREIFKGTMFSDDAKTRGRGDSNVPPSTGTTTSSTLVGSKPSATPWEMPELKTEKREGRPESDFVSTEERYTAVARAAYQKLGLDYPCNFPSSTLPSTYYMS